MEERKTVRRYATAATADQLISGPRLTRPGLLGPHQAYLRQRWDEGIRSTEPLHQELRERGYRGSERTLRRLTSQLRRNTAVLRHHRRRPPGRWSATATASTWKPGPATLRTARSATYEASPKDCVKTGPPSPPGSPCPTVPT